MQAETQLRDELHRAANTMVLDPEADLRAAQVLGARRRRGRRVGMALASSFATTMAVLVIAAGWAAVRDGAPDVIIEPVDSVPEAPVTVDPAPAGDDSETLDAAPPLAEAGDWLRVEALDNVELQNIVSDGNSFFGLTRGETGTELLRSDDGLAWESVTEVPFDQIESVRNGMVLGATDQRGSITIHVVAADGRITTMMFSRVVATTIEPYVARFEFSAALVGDDSVFLTSDYEADMDLVFAAGMGVPIDEVIAARDGVEGQSSESLVARALGMSLDEYLEINPGGFSGLGQVGIHLPDGDVAVELSDLGLTTLNPEQSAASFVAPIGGEWSEVNAPIESWSVQTIAGGLTAKSPDEGRQVITSDGVEWLPVEGLPDPELAADLQHVGTRGGRCGRGWFYLLGRPPTALFELTAAGVKATDVTGTEIAQLDFESVENNIGVCAWSTGNAGLAYTTGYTRAEDGPIRLSLRGPTALVTSTDALRWVREALPAELTADFGIVAVNATGILGLRRGDQDSPPDYWYRPFPE